MDDGAHSRVVAPAPPARRGRRRAIARRPLGPPGVRALAVGVAVCFALDYSLLLLGDSLVEKLVATEDGIVENAGAAAFLGASILFGVAYARARRRAHLVLALAFFLGAGEELAWGQHALGFGTPAAYERWNAQGEVTIHNLVFLQRGSYVPVDIVEVLFFVFAIIYTVLLPLLAARSAAARRALARRVPIVPGAFGALLLANLALAGSADGESSSGHRMTSAAATAAPTPTTTARRRRILIRAAYAFRPWRCT